MAHLLLILAVLMRQHVDDEQAAAGLQDAGNFGQRSCRIRRIMQHKRHHGRIELAKNELIGRLRGRDEGELSAVDVDALSRILAGRLPDLDRLEGD